MNKLNNEIVNEINFIYSNWKNTESIDIPYQTNIFTEDKVIKHDKNCKRNLYFNQIENNIKAVLLYDKEKEEYTVAVRNTQGLTYLFSNNSIGFFIFKENEMIQSNVDFKPYYEQEETEVILDTDKDLLVNEIYLKGLEKINFIEKIKNETKENQSFENIEKTKEEEIVNQNDFIVQKESEDNEEEVNEPLEINGEQTELDLSFEKEEPINKIEYNLVEKIKYLTGVSLLDSEHENYSKVNKIFMNIDLENKEESFKHIMLFSILSTEGFVDEEYDILNILEKFFCINRKVRNLNLFIVRKQKYLENNKFEYKILEKDQEILDRIRFNKKENVNIYIKETEETYDIFAFDFEGNKYEVTKNSNILNSSFFIEVTEEMKTVLSEDKTFIKYDYIIDNKLYFNKLNEKNYKESNKYLGYSTIQILNSDKELNIPNEKIVLFETININSEENNVYKKHYVMLENVQELINGYLKNPNLVYKQNPENETEEVQKEFLEMLFLVKDTYIKDISLLTKEEDNWNKSRKIKRIKKFIKTVNTRLQKDL